MSENSIDNRKSPQPQATDLAWAAGIIDGEGHIRLTLCKPGINRRATPGYQLCLAVRMTCEATIRRLYLIFGSGTVIPVRPRNPQKHKPTFQWRVSDQGAADVLIAISPYMTTKLSQAEIGIEFRRLCRQISPAGRGISYSAEMVELRRNYFDRMQRLNRKGPTQ